MPAKQTVRTKKNARPLPAPPERRRFRSRLLTWYGRHGRDLPWRKTADPYHILVSEIMLQQTQVDRVLPKYAEWLDKYPSFHALAAAPEQDVTDAWYPLGYNIRPVRLQGIGFGLAERFPPEALSGQRVDAVFHLILDEWRGEPRVQARILDLRLSEGDASPAGYSA